MGVNSYRFSISWSRILPDGIGKVNDIGVKFYSELVDLLIKNDIEPIVTLYEFLELNDNDFKKYTITKSFFKNI